MSVKTILDDIGSVFKKVFTGAVKVATASEPVVAMLWPGISTMFNSATEAVSTVEASALAAGAQTGTGAQKLALAIPGIESAIAAFAAQNKLTYNADSASVIGSSIVAILNEFSPITTTNTGSATSTTGGA